MKNKLSISVLGIFLIIAVPLSSRAEDLISQQSGSFGAEAKPRAFRLGVSHNKLLSEFSNQTEMSGWGLASSYEFILTPRFLLGINLEYRHFPGQQSLSQLGYGLLMKHYLKDANDSNFRTYLEYGLLMNVSRQNRAEGAGTAHDTRLAAGGDFQIFGEQAFADLAYHYSRLEFFDVTATNLDYFQFTLGVRWAWK